MASHGSMGASWGRAQLHCSSRLSIAHMTPSHRVWGRHGDRSTYMLMLVAGWSGALVTVTSKGSSGASS
jgi:hypothetical protein